MSASSGFSDPVTVATLVVAGVTALLALITFWQVRVTRSTLELSVRPLLANAKFDPTRQEKLLFGAPGRISPEVPHGALFYESSTGDAFWLSVAFENIGSGPAAVSGAYVTPAIQASVHVSPTFVAVGEVLRVNFSILTSMPDNERFRDFWWAMDGLAVTVEYSDTNNGQRIRTTAHIQQAATQAPWIGSVTIEEKGWRGTWKLMARGHGNY